MKCLLLILINKYLSTNYAQGSVVEIIKNKSENVLWASGTLVVL